jgi:hypothetical protein
MVFKLPGHARFVCLHFVCQVSPIQGGQETWLARYYQNVRCCVQETRLSSNPLIYVPFVLWHLRAENRAHHWCHSILFLSPTVLSIKLRLWSLYSCLLHRKYSLIIPRTDTPQQSVIFKLRRVILMSDLVVYCYCFSNFFTVTHRDECGITAHNQLPKNSAMHLRYPWTACKMPLGKSLFVWMKTKSSCTTQCKHVPKIFPATPRHQAG